MKTTTFTIQASAKVTATIEINATDWEDAVAKCKELNVPDFIKPACGEVFDDWDNFEIIGMFK